MPGLIRKALNYLDDTRRWEKAGRPLVSPEVRAQRRALCELCPKRNAENDSCSLCGCPLHETIFGDKLARATSCCPDDPPRWEETVSPEEKPIPEELRALSGLEGFAPVYVNVQELKPDDLVLVNLGIEGGKLVQDKRQVRALVPGPSGVHRVVRDFVVLNQTQADVRFGLLHIRDSKGMAVQPIAG